MSRPPRCSRRNALAALGIGGLASLAGCTTAYSALPDRASYARTRRRSIPAVPSPVYATDEHLHDLADEIADYAADGLEAWERMGERERFVVYSERRLEDDLEFAETRPWESATADTARSARSHLWHASGAFVYATVRTDGFEGDPAAGTEQALEEAGSHLEDFEYVTDDPATFLTYGRFLEYELQQAHSLLSHQLKADVDDRSDNTSRAERLAEIYSTVRQGRSQIDLATAYHDTLRERDPGGDPFGERMANARATLRERTDELLEDREDWSGRIGEFEGNDVGESESGRRDVHDALYSRSHRGESDARSIERYVDEGYEVYGTVELATAWLVLAAARGERDRLEAAGTDRLDSGWIDTAKRDAVDRLEDLLADEPDPLTLFFAEEGRSLIYSGDRGLERSSLDDDADWQWRQANGYARYLLAKGILGKIPDVRSLLVDGD
ncbi:hypothetical protein AB7C87_06155 [Natrarchaeobius sp. A-rgal3]|uniref:hypothetical protein n=1 Tax=Natrarchaeobius versutus TaxID=1679078 RepID=UPI00350F348D